MVCRTTNGSSSSESPTRLSRACSGTLPGQVWRGTRKASTGSSRTPRTSLAKERRRCIPGARPTSFTSRSTSANSSGRSRCSGLRGLVHGAGHPLEAGLGAVRPARDRQEQIPAPSPKTSTCRYSSTRSGKCSTRTSKGRGPRCRRTSRASPCSRTSTMCSTVGKTSTASPTWPMSSRLRQPLGTTRTPRITTTIIITITSRQS